MDPERSARTGDVWKLEHFVSPLGQMREAFTNCADGLGRHVPREVVGWVVKSPEALCWVDVERMPWLTRRRRSEIREHAIQQHACAQAYAPLIVAFKASITSDDPRCLNTSMGSAPSRKPFAVVIQSMTTLGSQACMASATT